MQVRRFAPWAIVALLLVAAAGWLALRGSGDDAGEPAADASGAIAFEPSVLARSTVSRGLLELYADTGRQFGLDWSVIAAVDQYEQGAAPVSQVERVSAIAYSLEAGGAPDDYRLALETRSESAEYAAAVLKLADRYRTAGVRPPAARGALRFPIDGTVIVGYGPRFGILHDGIDIAAPSGTPIRAAAAGIVATTTVHPLFGIYTCILHRYPRSLRGQRQLTTCYGNQSGHATEPGQRVRAGQVIGRSGCSGQCLRPHLHFQVRLGKGPEAETADPARFLDREVRVAPGRRPLERTR